ncbi:hypothetical protein [Corynebacterium macginleyi]|uniref:hypothetical protein n=1 Tax=Corynebacterium macginleyi TaxID=38290 RepID=UPI00190C52AA|nr:hypothetical protein [Corynebacterium macginleyi]MBK4137044.1 hypothetical protein [Corynebacterium macginleyi]MBK4146442.1 hypothetical protein [Corynebacterium macginleyi]
MITALSVTLLFSSTHVPSAYADTKNGTNCMNSFGCTEIPKEILDEQAPPNIEARKAWAQCWSSMLLAGVPAAKGASILKGLTKATGAASLAAFAGCDFDKMMQEEHH